MRTFLIAAMFPMALLIALATDWIVAVIKKRRRVP
jgi:hypothetical protein